jgi:RHS repeat-associated protein
MMICRLTVAATHADAVDQLFYYTGQERDAATGLQYHSDGSPTGRWYDPRTGRWLSEDPVNAPNLYPYADNDPINKVDPTGRTPDFNPLTKLPGLNTVPNFNSGLGLPNYSAPAVNLAGGLNSYSTPKAIDQYFFNQGLPSPVTATSPSIRTSTAPLPTDSQILSNYFNNPEYGSIIRRADEATGQRIAQQLIQQGTGDKHL